MNLTKRLIIRGRVQGVYFRESMRRRASELRVTGWVRNRRDGSVEALVQGDAHQVEAIIAWSKIGPEAAYVTAVEVSDAEGEFISFEKRKTE